MRHSIRWTHSAVRTLAAVGAAFAAISLFVPPQPAHAQATVKGKYGDWEMRCETPAGASREQCAIIQSVSAEDKPNMTLVVIALKAADGKSRLLRVIAPLLLVIFKDLETTKDRQTRILQNR